MLHFFGHHRNIRQAALTVPIDGWIAYAPVGDEQAFEGIVADGTSLTLADGQTQMPEAVTGFGRCLFHTFIDLLALGYGGVVVLNSDSPTLPTARLSEAAALLLKAGDRAVMGNAEDGGYYLLGLKQLYHEPFCNISWSTEIVAEQTRRSIASFGLDLVELEPWYDVDDEFALNRLMRDLSSPSDAFKAPATAACVERLKLPARLAG